MRFAAASRFNAGDYASAATAGAKAVAQTFDAARKNAPDWTGLARTSMNTRSAERQTAMKAEADVATAGMKAFGNVKGMQIKGAYALEARKTEIDTRKRMAGRLGALGGFKLPKKSKSEYYNKRIEQLDAMKDSPGSAEVGGPAPLPTGQSQEQIRSEFADQGPSLPQQQQQQPPTNPSSSGVTQTGVTQTGFSLTDAQADGLAAIREVESGGLGYNAYNLGGKTEFDPIGSGTAKDGRFGKPLTQMTIAEIDQLGQAGKIHATGAYQFTHNTGSFMEAAGFAGLGPNDLFTPANQDKMALNFGQKYGWQRWSGLKRSPSHRDRAIAGFS